MEERTKEEIEWHFNRFIDVIRDYLNQERQLDLNQDEIVVRVDKGRVYWKIWVDNLSGWGMCNSHVFGFVRKKDGAILRPADRNKPETRTKSAIRGYVYDEHLTNYFTRYGIVYAEGQ